MWRGEIFGNSSSMRAGVAAGPRGPELLCLNEFVGCAGRLIAGLFCRIAPRRSFLKLREQNVDRSEGLVKHHADNFLVRFAGLGKESIASGLFGEKCLEFVVDF